MLGRILYVLCTYGVVAFGCAFVGAALGIAASRAFRGERGASWLTVLIGLVAGGLFLMLTFMLTWESLGRPMLAGGLQVRVLGLLVLLGVGFATPPVIRADQAAEAIRAAAIGVVLTLILLVFATASLGSNAMRAVPYLLGTLAPALLGALFGWGLSWRRDLDALLDAELSRNGRRPAG
jgi:hypothetical protein